MIISLLGLNEGVYHYDGMHKMTMFPTCVPCTALDSTAGNMFPTVIPHKVNGIGPIRLLGFMYIINS